MILRRFRERASAIGVRQFVVQTHFESPMEVTPEVRDAVARLLDAGWVVTNQLVFTTAASRRGHAAKLRQVLEEVGVLPYYTFTVKGYMENWHNFAPNARAIQEQIEEKCFGNVPAEYFENLSRIVDEPKRAAENIAELREKSDLPFLGTDRNVLNLPAVGKSLTFRTIGITRYGRRVLQFDHDRTRAHSPIIEHMGKVIVIESKSISEYVRHLGEIGEDPAEYQDLWGYSVGVTEPRLPIYEYPDYGYQVTSSLTNLELPTENDAAEARDT
jgi:lysine 2,3-aminomutase